MQSSNRGLAPRPPEKGSFPLDHKGECNQIAVEYNKVCVPALLSLFVFFCLKVGC